ncbi:MAG: OprO/OprP family phosphate-selective porin [Opitutaceae bacterium]|jgi:phosphate-selective porin OprO/OprP|nr:OprO/OprP family phosphate-selective porin [Opitutaceae bacterium]
MRNLTVSRAAAYAAAFSTIAFAPFSARAQTTDAPPEDVAALRAQIAALDQKLRVLERNLEIKDDTAAAAAKTAPVITAGAGGFSLTSADKKFSLRIRGNIQADGRYYLEEKSDASDTPDAFVLRRIRPSFEGTVGEKFGFRIMPDFANNQLQLLDAYATYKQSDEFSLLFGKAKSPFDLERLVSQTNLLFIERSYPTLLGPNRDTGVQASGDLFAGRFSYQAAYLDGASDGGSVETDTNDGKDAVLRLFTHPFKNNEDSFFKGLGFGVAYSAGTREVGSGAIRSYTTNALVPFFQYNGNVRPDGDHTRLSPQIYFYKGPFGLLASYTETDQELINTTTVTPASVRGDFANRAWAVTANYVLTGEDTGYNTSPKPRQDFNLSAGTWGAWEVAARVSAIDVDEGAFAGAGTGIFANRNTQAAGVDSLSLGLNWYLNRNVKASLNFEHSSFDEAAGRSASLEDFEDENAVLTRVQLSF